MRLPHRLQGQKVKSQGGAGAYCGGHLAAQLVKTTAKRSFYRSANAIFGKVGRIASE